MFLMEKKLFRVEFFGGWVFFFLLVGLFWFGLYWLGFSLNKANKANAEGFGRNRSTSEAGWKIPPGPPVSTDFQWLQPTPVNLVLLFH